MHRRALLMVVAVTGLLLAYQLWAWNRPLVSETVTVQLPQGAGLNRIAYVLQDAGIVKQRRRFVLLAYLRGASRRLKAGEYQVMAGTSAWGLLSQLVAGRVLQYPFAIIEGWNFREVRQALANAPGLMQTLKDYTDAALMEKLGARGEHPEGRFYPDTYLYTRGETDAALLKRAYTRMKKKLDQEWQTRDPDVPLKSAYEALILASIVEKETGQVSERPLIAGVFINRLRRNMRLQTDPTVIYGLGEHFDGNLRLRDLRNDTPYNTYTRHGLPPTPIAMPGGDAIHAALHPDATRALYFVSRGDGSHVFSDTLKEHNRAVIRFQLKGQPLKRQPDANEGNG